MKQGNRQFTMAIIIAGIMACSLILAYFTVLAPTTEMPDAMNLKAKPGTTPGPVLSALGPAEKSPEPQKAAGTPSAAPPPVEFTAGKADAIGPKADFSIKTDVVLTVLPPARLAPEMFAYSSLPFDAPLAEFPLVLVGQKYLEWYKTPRDPLGASAGGIGSSPIYGRPPPPGTPPTPPGPPRPPPPQPPPQPPPKPPPEVSTSGI